MKNYIFLYKLHWICVQSITSNVYWKETNEKAQKLIQDAFFPKLLRKLAYIKKITAVDTGKEQQVVKAFLPFFWRASLKIYVNLSSIALFTQFF